MTKEEQEKIKAALKNYNNIETLLADLLEPIDKIKKKYSCTTSEEACNYKIKAEEYLTKYGCITLNATTKAITKLITD